MWECVAPIRVVHFGTPPWGHALGGTVSRYSTIMKSVQVVVDTHIIVYNNLKHKLA